MKAEAFVHAGRTIYGPSWQFALADALGVSTRSIARWAHAERSIPDGIPGDLRKIAGARIKELETLSERLEHA